MKTKITLILFSIAAQLPVASASENYVRSNEEFVIKSTDGTPLTYDGLARRSVSEKQVEIVEEVVTSLEPQVQDVFFRTNSIALNSNDKDQLKSSLDLAKNAKKVIISGYADTQGAVNHNLELSKKRARTVKKFFEKWGIQSQMIEAKGLGETSASDLSQARKVEVKFIY